MGDTDDPAPRDDNSNNFRAFCDRRRDRRQADDGAYSPSPSLRSTSAPLDLPEIPKTWRIGHIEPPRNQKSTLEQWLCSIGEVITDATFLYQGRGDRPNPTSIGKAALVGGILFVPFAVVMCALCTTLIPGIVAVLKIFMFLSGGSSAFLLFAIVVLGFITLDCLGLIKRVNAYTDRYFAASSINKKREELALIAQQKKELEAKELKLNEEIASAKLLWNNADTYLHFAERIEKFYEFVEENRLTEPRQALDTYVQNSDIVERMMVHPLLSDTFRSGGPLSSPIASERKAAIDGLNKRLSDAGFM